MRVRWSKTALNKVEEIGNYIALDNRNAAGRWIEAVVARARSLRHLPRRGRPVLDIDWDEGEVREIIYGKYRIIYCLEKNQIVVLTVYHFSQMLRPTEIARARDIIMPDDPMRGPLM